MLCEQHDLASHTSSASTKLIHGGLRYLEHYDFGLVRKSLREREVVLASAPHLAWPLRFVLPHDDHLRPGMDDPRGTLSVRPPRRAAQPAGVEDGRPAHAPGGRAARERYRTGFVYSDGWVDDARLVVANAIDARERGATRPDARAGRATAVGGDALARHAASTRPAASQVDRRHAAS